jgi:hypothetical protein
MKTAKKAAIGLFLFLFILGISTAEAATPDWGVVSGDTIRWDASFHQDNPFITSTLSWYVIFTVDGFPEFNGMNYINGSVNENGTITDSVSLSPLTPRTLGSGNYIGDVLDDIHIGINLISDSTELADLTAGFEYLEGEYPAYSFTENVSQQIFTFLGSGSESGYDWTYSAVINYTSDKVLYSIEEDYYQIDTVDPGLGDTAIQEYRWTRTSYDHGTGEGPPDPDPDLDIPGYGVPMLLATLVVGIVILVRKQKLI